MQQIFQTPSRPSTAGRERFWLVDRLEGHAAG
jgi:hypothetical protein